MYRDLPVVRPELKGLYQRIGGEEALGRILQEFYRRMQDDLLVGFFFDGHDVPQIAARQKEFLMRAMGASPSYTGKPPAQAHLALPPILEGHFDRRLRLLEETLRDEGVSAEDIRIWLGFENAFREGIVRPEGPVSPPTDKARS